MKGKFITFEGPEGSGKSTQTEMLHSYLLEKGYDCLKTHEPGGTGVGEMIRKIVLGCRDEIAGYGVWGLGSAAVPTTPDTRHPTPDTRHPTPDTRHPTPYTLAVRAELLLILADRAQHTTEVILPALNAGTIVLCDRYNDSTMAYQGYGRGLDLEEVRRLCEYASQGLQPDRTFLLDVDVVLGLSRTKERHDTRGADERADRFESLGREFHERLRSGYLSLAKEEPGRIIVLDPSYSIGEMHNKIVGHTEVLLRRA